MTKILKTVISLSIATLLFYITCNTAKPRKWAAHDTITATIYTFALCPDNVHDAIALGVHTPGDSDSIASMAGALVGTRDNIIANEKDQTLIEKYLEEYDELYSLGNL